MSKSLCYFLLYVFTVACRNSTTNKENKSSRIEHKDSIVSFCKVDEDRASIRNYRFEKGNAADGPVSFKYIRQKDTFSIFCDTLNKKYQGKFGKGDAIELDIEKLKFYTINGTEFLVLKLIGDKNVIDGAFSIFVSPEFGVLLIKSNTWRTAQVLCPDKDDPLFLRLTTLLYYIQTDNEFFLTPVPSIRDMEKFTPPKVE